MPPFIFDPIFSFKKELLFVSFAFLLALLLPIIAVIILTHTGIDAVSDRLVQYDETTKTIKLFYPNGSLYKEILVNVTWPVRGIVTNEFGTTVLPYYVFHSGIDIANPYGLIGDPITTFMPGTVTYEGEIFWGFGKHIIINNGDNITSLYGHLDKIFVIRGQQVKPGDIIGLEGDTGWSTGPHLHFQINVFGIPVNPRIFVGEGNP
ncbi:hypothetical protein A2164_00050 [Candidatus Curtissbacteria bacterium RBG_13_35_7]|uniref:M23ase beta-sheet core domain-containing protein n=1 Tax=Candidatus Curtissbacteria bacterium RBG_13_35_7 TaxID=1797705 RepID=A0A1F5G026_9BACT|nr:MAG: hypothetical protein A2164_00050 [Candidatus Curtissbacteria bacterium RBG_13_35_7]